MQVRLYSLFSSRWTVLVVMSPPGTLMEVRGLRATPRSVKEGRDWRCPAEVSPHLQIPWSARPAFRGGQVWRTLWNDFTLKEISQVWGVAKTTCL